MESNICEAQTNNGEKGIPTTDELVVEYDSHGDLKCPRCGGTFLIPFGNTVLDDEEMQTEFVCDDCQSWLVKIWNMKSREIIELF